MSGKVLSSGNSARSDKHSKLEALRKLGDLLICDICHELLEDPYGLPCLHKFCEKCIHEHMFSKNACPTCKQYTQPKDCVKHLKLNEIVTSFRCLRDAVAAMEAVTARPGQRGSSPLASLSPSSSSSTSPPQANCPATSRVEIDSAPVRADLFELSKSSVVEQKENVRHNRQDLRSNLASPQKRRKRSVGCAGADDTQPTSEWDVPELPASPHPSNEHGGSGTLSTTQMPSFAGSRYDGDSFSGWSVNPRTSLGLINTIPDTFCESNLSSIREQTASGTQFEEEEQEQGQEQEREPCEPANHHLDTLNDSVISQPLLPLSTTPQRHGSSSAQSLPVGAQEQPSHLVTATGTWIGSDEELPMTIDLTQVPEEETQRTHISPGSAVRVSPHQSQYSISNESQLLDQIQYFVRSPASPPRVVVCCTNVDPSTLEKLQRCKDQGIVQDVVTSPSRITHLVTRAVNADSSYRLCMQTMKYLRSLVQGAHIVDAQWVDDSLEQGAPVPQLAPYRIHGTTRDIWMKATDRAREDCLANGRSTLFSNFEFAFHCCWFSEQHLCSSSPTAKRHAAEGGQRLGDRVTIEDLVTLIRACGGELAATGRPRRRRVLFVYRSERCRSYRSGLQPTTKMVQQADGGCEVRCLDEKRAIEAEMASVLVDQVIQAISDYKLCSLEVPGIDDEDI